MRADGTPGWEVREGTSREVLVALYLRDALGVVDPSGLPRLLGTGLPAVPTASDEVGRWWTRWWVSVVEPEPIGWGGPLRALDEEGLVVLPESGAESYVGSVRRHLDDARTWAEVARDQADERAADRARRGDDLVVVELVTARAAALLRPVDPFRLRVEVIPLTVAGIWWISEDTIAVDEQLRDDTLLFREAMRPVIDQLA